MSTNNWIYMYNELLSIRTILKNTVTRMIICYNTDVCYNTEICQRNQQSGFIISYSRDYRQQLSTDTNKDCKMMITAYL